MEAIRQRRRFRFGVFEVHADSGEVHKHGIRLQLQDQPFKVLLLLLERPGEVVTREELRHMLWPRDTFVDFDTGLNSAIKRLRDALSDNADSPRYIETLPRRGYRFIAPVDRVDSGTAQSVPVDPVPDGPSVLQAVWSRVGLGQVIAWSFAGALLLISALTLVNSGDWRKRIFGSQHPRIQRIAVLPLENLTGDSGQEFFVDGITEALTTELSQIKALTVISRTSTIPFKGTRTSLVEIAQKLNVQAVIEGAVQRSGDRVRITVQLIETSTESHLWSRTFERHLTDVLSLQAEFAREVAQQVQIEVSPGESARLLAPRRGVLPAAYEANLKGRSYWNNRTKESLYKAKRSFELAIQLDPSYAAAYAGLADTDAILGFGVVPILLPKDAAEMATAAALRAIELDPTLADPHATLGLLKCRYEWDWAGAEAEYQKALELSPGNVTAHVWYSQFLMSMRRFKEASLSAQRARQLDPITGIVLVNEANMFHPVGRFDKEVEGLLRVREFDPKMFFVSYDLGSAYEQMGRYDEALREFRKTLELSGENLTVQSCIAHLFAVSGNKGEAERILKRLLPLAEKENLKYQIAQIYAGLERKDEAFAWLEKAFQARAGWMAWLLIEQKLNPLRSDPRFSELLRKMRFPEKEIQRKWPEPSPNT